MAAADASYYHASLYRFSKDAQDEVIHQFDSAVNDRSTICRYAAKSDANRGAEMYALLARIIDQYTEKETAMAEEAEEDNAPKVQRMADSLDEPLLDGPETPTTTETSVDEMKDNRDCLYWVPKSGSDLIAVASSSVLTTITGLTGCVLTVDHERRCVAISGGDNNSASRASAKLRNVERDMYRRMPVTHFVEIENTKSDALQMFRPNAKGVHRFLRRVLLPAGSKWQEELHKMCVTRLLESKSAKLDLDLYAIADHAVPTPTGISSLPNIWSVIKFTDVGEEKLEDVQLERTAADTPITRPAGILMPPARVLVVDQWMQGLDNSELQSPPATELSSSSGYIEGLRRAPSTNRIGRKRVPKAAAHSVNPSANQVAGRKRSEKATSPTIADRVPVIDGIEWNPSHSDVDNSVATAGPSNVTAISQLATPLTDIATQDMTKPIIEMKLATAHADLFGLEFGSVSQENYLSTPQISSMKGTPRASSTLGFAPTVPYARIASGRRQKLASNSDPKVATPRISSSSRRGKQKQSGHDGWHGTDADSSHSMTTAKTYEETIYDEQPWAKKTVRTRVKLTSNLVDVSIPPQHPPSTPTLPALKPFLIPTKDAGAALLASA
ncbi:hypothetical protein B0A49_06431 [Cryomyces minteri]|uniref:Uncharacterized protein n=1 Tax=Cryomyces minteri TaxID=331657 RepID=A0A4U0X289_9PEZI|nr:hypothetical protein B0A49_06431 [Cryomyces minteri]